MKIYIAGPMTGIPDFNYHAFFEMEHELKQLGHQPENPARHDGATAVEAIAAAGSLDAPAHSWSWYLKRDIPKLVASDAVVLLPGWQHSRGASLEVHIAQELGLPLFIFRDGKLAPRVQVIGLSGYGRSGKDTIGSALQKRGFVRAAFADRIRESLYALNPLASSHERVQEIIDRQGWEASKTTHPEIRVLLQRLGAEVGRDLLGSDIWVDLTFRSLPDGAKVVVTDCRFPNEAEAIKRIGGEIWRVHRPGTGPANTHESEIALDGYPFQRIFVNDSTVADLHQKVYDALKDVQI